MRPKKIISLFSNNQTSLNDAKSYLNDENLLKKLIFYQQKSPNRLQPDFIDLARIHFIVRKRKVFNILEFGVGYSSFVMLDALKKITWIGKIFQ